MVNEENLFVLFVCRRWSCTVTLMPSRRLRLCCTFYCCFVSSLFTTNKQALDSLVTGGCLNQWLAVCAKQLGLRATEAHSALI